MVARGLLVLGWTVLSSLVQEGRCEEIEEERPEGGVPGRDMWWHGAPGGRSRKCRLLRQPGESRSSPQARGRSSVPCWLHQEAWRSQGAWPAVVVQWHGWLKWVKGGGWREVETAITDSFVGNFSVKGSKGWGTWGHGKVLLFCFMWSYQQNCGWSWKWSTSKGEPAGVGERRWSAYGNFSQRGLMEQEARREHGQCARGCS